MLRLETVQYLHRKKQNISRHCFIFPWNIYVCATAMLRSWSRKFNLGENSKFASTGTFSQSRRTGRQAFALVLQSGKKSSLTEQLLRSASIPHSQSNPLIQFLQSILSINNQFLQSGKSSLTEQLLRSASIPHSRQVVQLCMTFLFRWLFGWLPSDGMYLWERFAFNTGLGFETRKVFQICDCFQIHKTLAVFKRGKLILSAQVDPHPDMKANLINHFKFCAWGGALKVHLKILFPFSLTVI